MCTGCNPTVVFSWLGGLLVNASFVALISWGTATAWPIGLALSILYTALLFAAAIWLRRRSETPPIAASLLLLLAVLGVGVAGLILSINALGCSPAGISSNSLPVTWVLPPSANATPEVTAWASEEAYLSGSQATYVFDAATGSSFISGRNATQQNRDRTWRLTSTGVQLLEPSSPFSMVIVPAAGRVCFVGYLDVQGASAVHCYLADGTSFVTLTAAPGSPAPRNPRGLLVDSFGSLWFKADAPFGISPFNGVAYRADLATSAAAVLISIPSSGAPPPPPPLTPGQLPDSCNEEEGFRHQAIATLCLSSLPVLITAALLWWRLDTPSMTFATFVGASAVVINVFIIANPSGNGAYEFIQWWFTSFSAVWLIVFAALALTHRVRGDVLAWAVNVGCLAYFAAVHSLTGVPFESSSLRWVVYNLTLVAPMLLLALIVSPDTSAPTYLPLILASAGIFLTTWRVTSELTSLVANPTAQTLIRFAVLGLAGESHTTWTLHACLSPHLQYRVPSRSWHNSRRRGCHRSRRPRIQSLPSEYCCCCRACIGEGVLQVPEASS